jgi:hypothetical protein
VSSTRSRSPGAAVPPAAAAAAATTAAKAKGGGSGSGGPSPGRVVAGLASNCYVAADDEVVIWPRVRHGRRRGG